MQKQKKKVMVKPARKEMEKVLSTDEGISTESSSDEDMPPVRKDNKEESSPGEGDQQITDKAQNEGNKEGNKDDEHGANNTVIDAVSHRPNEPTSNVKCRI